MKVAISFIEQVVIRGLLPAIVVLIAAYGASSQRTTPVAKGDWGATGVSVNVSDAGASIEFDCANATITKQLRVKRDGSFAAYGNFMRSGPGPVRIGDDDKGRPVVFKGKVKHKTMAFRMTDAKTGESLGDYTVTQGRSSRLHRCY